MAALDDALDELSAQRDRTLLHHLVRRLADLEPRYGWTRESFLAYPLDLTQDEQRLIWRVDGVNVSDEIDSADLIDAALDRSAARSADLVHEACRAALFYLVQKECDARREAQAYDRAERQWRRREADAEAL